MCGIGTQEMVIIGLLFLVVFGPSKLPGIARDFGRFVNQARSHVDEFKSELTSSEYSGSSEHARGDHADVDQNGPARESDQHTSGGDQEGGIDKDGQRG
jgi:sec-independent protein translocase protein TatB